ncbi:MAG: hypothetical protein V4581_16125 [Bacteroidota bacterium]
MKPFFLLPSINLASNFWIITLLVITLLLAVAVIVLFKKQAALFKNVEKNAYPVKGTSQKSFTTKADENQLNDIISRLIRLENKSKTEPETSVPVARTIVTMTEDEKPYEVNFLPPEKPKVISFYMSTPNPDGSFDVNQSSEEFRPTISLYKFTSDPKDSFSASFEFYSDEIGTKDALANPKRYLEPVCYEENDAFLGARKIIIKKAGIASKNGDKWTVEKNQKLIIQYQ